MIHERGHPADWTLFRPPAPGATGGPQGRERTRQTFEAFHAEHPGVYEEFVRRALALRRAGHARYSARTIIEAMRWEYDRQRVRPAEFKLNDHINPHYARLAMAEHPELRGFFETRERDR